MTTFLCDTNVLGELTRREPNPGVLAWAAGTVEVAVSVVTVEEIAYGLAWRPAPRIAAWFEEFLEGCRVLPVTDEVARVSGELRGTLMARGEPRSQADMLIAATAKAHDLTVVTRNVRHFVGCGVSVLNPFS